VTFTAEELKALDIESSKMDALRQAGVSIATLNF
jgi:hypothetical protein